MSLPWQGHESADVAWRGFPLPAHTTRCTRATHTHTHENAKTPEGRPKGFLESIPLPLQSVAFVLLTGREAGRERERLRGSTHWKR